LRVTHKNNLEKGRVNACITQDLKVARINTVRSGLAQDLIRRIILKSAMFKTQMLEGAEAGMLKPTAVAKETMKTTMIHRENEAAEDKDVVKGIVGEGNI
jgi:hypothetical protein